MPNWLSLNLTEAHINGDLKSLRRKFYMYNSYAGNIMQVSQENFIGWSTF